MPESDAGQWFQNVVLHGDDGGGDKQQNEAEKNQRVSVADGRVAALYGTVTQQRFHHAPQTCADAMGGHGLTAVILAKIYVAPVDEK